MTSWPSFRARTEWRYCAVDTALTTTPASTRAVPVQSENSVDVTGILGAAGDSWREQPFASTNRSWRNGDFAPPRER